MPPVLSRAAAPPGAPHHGPASGDAAEDDALLMDIIRQRKLRRLQAAVAIRRRQIRAALAGEAGQGPQGSKRRETSFFSWTDHLARMTERDFKLRYRLDYNGFRELLKLIRGDLEVTNEKMARRAKWGYLVEPEVKLAMTLRYLAAASPLDLQLIYFVSKSYVYSCVWSVVDAINRRLKVEFPIDDVEKLKVLEAEWASRAHCKGWRGQVAAVDGVHFAMCGPSNKQVKDPMRYYVARKSEYALLCMACCDADRRILDYDISQVPTTHDSQAFAISDLGRRVCNGELPAPFFINGDAAFSLSNSVITPAGGGSADLDKFDYHQSSNRVAIECAFGMLVKRWSILWKPLTVRFDRRAPLIGACIRLHNFCIDHRIAEETRDENGISEVQPNRYARTPKFDKEGRPVRYLQILRGPAQRHPRAGLPTATRDRLLAAVLECEIFPPRLAPGIRKKQRKKQRKRRGGRST